MPRFFVEHLEDRTVIAGEEARHMTRSLRMREGDRVTLCDGRGTDAEAIIEFVDERQVALRVERRMPSRSEPRLQVTLFQALPKSDKLEFIVQKATELGICAVQPFLSRYCVSRPDDFGKKQVRLQKIAAEAAKQAGRGRIPEVLPLLDMVGACASLAGFDRVVFCYERAEAPLSSALGAMDTCARMALVVGSEGGFSEEEAGRFTAAGALPVGLGPRILRCETAPIAALSALLYAAGEMDPAPGDR